MTQKKHLPVEVSHQEILAEIRKNRPGVAKAYDALAPEFNLISQLVALRNECNLTQSELAKLVGTKQPSIARLESTGHIGSIAFLQRIAEALNATLKITLLPNAPMGLIAGASSRAQPSRDRFGGHRVTNGETKVGTAQHRKKKAKASA